MGNRFDLFNLKCYNIHQVVGCFDMKIISLSKSRFEQLEKLKLSKEIRNTESIVYDFNYRGDEKVLKTLYLLNGSTFANKLYTIEMLDSNKENLPSSFYIPDCLCSVDGKIIGFTIPKIQGTNLSVILKSYQIDYKEQIYYLKKIGELLNQLSNIRKYTNLKDIYINDLQDSNFMVDNSNKELKVIDLDSCKICSNEPFAARFLTSKSIINGISKYKLNKNNHNNGYIIPNEDSDLYCYCMVILNYLYGDSVYTMPINEYYDYLNYLRYIGINKKLISTFGKLVANCKNENPMNYLDSLNIEQISRAKKIVYNKVKK